MSLKDNTKRKELFIMQNRRILTGIMTFILLMSCSLSSYAITTQLLKNYDSLGGGVVPLQTELLLWSKEK